jgi:hypothetical protein
MSNPNPNSNATPTPNLTRTRTRTRTLGTPIAKEMALLSSTLPVEMELELKLLYTGITRSCHHLSFLETSHHAPSVDAWFRCLPKLQLGDCVDGVALAASAKGRIVTAKEWLAEGMDLASLAEDSLVEESIDLWERAVETFQRAGEGGTGYNHRAQLQLAVAKARLQYANEKTEEHGAALANLAVTCLRAGMSEEAARICEENCDKPHLRKLGKRIKHVGNLSRTLNLTLTLTLTLTLNPKP